MDEIMDLLIATGIGVLFCIVLFETFSYFKEMREIKNENKIDERDNY